MKHFLQVISGPDKGKTFQLTEASGLLVGRSKNTSAQLTDPRVSRVHCEIEVRKGRLVVSDLDSNSGVFVNGKRVTDAALRTGDVIKLGQTSLRVVDDLTEAPTVEPTVLAPPRPPMLPRGKMGQLTGKQLSHYQIGPIVAEGQSGVVFKATDFKYDRDVALKVLWPESTLDEEEVQRFIRAMKTVIALRHPNLVALFGAGKTGNYCWLAMEFVEGDSLAKVIEGLSATKQIDWRPALNIAVRLARALEYAHSKGVIHRNVTPHNVLVGVTPDIVKLGDLMLAKALEGKLAQQITRPGEILGDVRYMAPERASGDGVVDERSDLYSLGALTYALLTGKPPFQGANMIDTVTKILSAPLTRPRSYQPDTPDILEKILIKLLARKPEQRFQKAREVRTLLEKVAKQQGVRL